MPTFVLWVALQTNSMLLSASSRSCCGEGERERERVGVRERGRKGEEREREEEETDIQRGGEQKGKRERSKSTHLPPWDGTAKIRLLSEVLVDEVVLTTHEQTTRPITPTRHYRGGEGR